MTSKTVGSLWYLSGGVRVKILSPGTRKNVGLFSDLYFQVECLETHGKYTQGQTLKINARNLWPQSRLQHDFFRRRSKSTDWGYSGGSNSPTYPGEPPIFY